MVCPNCLAHGPCDPDVSAMDAWDTRHLENNLRNDAIAATHQLERLKSVVRNLLESRTSQQTVWAMTNLRETYHDLTK